MDPPESPYAFTVDLALTPKAAAAAAAAIAAGAGGATASSSSGSSTRIGVLKDLEGHLRVQLPAEEETKGVPSVTVKETKGEWLVYTSE
jgi:hypothetical protein